MPFIVPCFFLSQDFGILHSFHSDNFLHPLNPVSSSFTQWIMMYSLKLSENVGSSEAFLTIQNPLVLKSFLALYSSLLLNLPRLLDNDLIDCLFWPSQVALGGKEPACPCRRHKRYGFDPWVGKIPWRRAWQPTSVSLPGESPRTEEPGKPSPQSQRVGHDWRVLACTQLLVWSFSHLL